MSIFGDDGQAVITSLSDDGLEERQEEEQPQTEPDDIEKLQEAEEASPEQEEEPEQTSGEGGTGQAPENEGQAQFSTEDYTRLQTNYNELRSWTSRVDTRNRQLEKEIAALKAQAPTLDTSPAEGLKDSEEGIRERVRALVDDPEQFLEPIINSRLKPLLEERAAREQAEAEQRQAREFNDTYRECESYWPQLNDATGESKRQMVAEMVKLSSMRGDANAWKSDPGHYLIDACRSLWGWPQVNNQSAIEAARKAEREAVLAEMEGKRRKAGLTINQQGNTSPLSTENDDEDPIVADIRKVAGRGMF